MILKPFFCAIFIIGLLGLATGCGEKNNKKESKTNQCPKKITKIFTYGLPDEIWKTCHYIKNLEKILDMTTTTWESLSLEKQRKYARVYQENYARKIGKKIEKNFEINKVSFKMVLIPPGRFWMGTSVTKAQKEAKQKRHRVVISKPYYMGKYEVTNKQYRKFARKTHEHLPKWWKKGNVYHIKTGSNNRYKKLGKALKNKSYPVIGVSWIDAISFCEWSQMRLPTEAEWEYGCRAGTTYPYHLGTSITTALVNYNGYSHQEGRRGIFRRKTVPAGSLSNANSWSCYDFHGNVSEWCADRYGDCSGGEQIDPVGPRYGYERILRGGNWNSSAYYCRSAARNWLAADGSDFFIGFRIARNIN